MCGTLGVFRMRRYLCLVRLVSVCAVMLVPFLAAAQVGIEPRRSGAVGFAVAAGPDFVASPGFVDDSSGNGDGVANPGEGLRAEDLTGHGHQVRSLGDEPYSLVTIPAVEE